MPHNIPEEKEWLHLRDAICLGDVDVIVDQLFKEGIPITYVEMERELISLKTNLGWDACAVVDKETFQESINELISESIAIPQPQDAPEFRTYKDSLADGRWDRIFDDMVARASSRIESGPSRDNVNIDPYIFLPLYWGARDRGEESFMYEGREVLVAYAFYMVQAAGWADVTPEELSRGDDYPGPSHYTDETPEGVLEAMERRLSGERGTAQDLLLDALAQMELKVGELSQAVSGLGTAVPTPIVEAVEAVEEAVEVVEGEVSGRGRGRVPSPKSQAIRDYALSLGAELATVTSADIAALISQRFPGTTGHEVLSSLSAPWRASNNLPNLKPTTRRFTNLAITPQAPRGRTPNPRTVAIRDYALSLGAELANTSSGDIVNAISQQYPDVTRQEVLSALSVTWRAANNLPNLSPMQRGAPPAPLPPPPPVIETGEAADVPPGTSLIDRLRQMPRPERIHGV